ncbi:serine hydrolase [Bacillus sp. JCM 19034]|uniref:serine hydrolase n=1 Tax=Bacillus sp. JCM 19034 TaxID=1481928 RepID=UPI0007844837|nr:serine hydrolase [Bacillus sp. JCM 19034]
MKTNYEQKIDTIFNKLTKSSQIHESVLLIESKNGDFSYKKVYGGKTEETLLLLASITKLFTTTCIFALEEKGKLSLDDKIVNYFDQHLINKLHVYKGVDYSAELTISHLMCQTSGLPDVLRRGKIVSKSMLFKRIYTSVLMKRLL